MTMGKVNLKQALLAAVKAGKQPPVKARIGTPSEGADEIKEPKIRILDFGERKSTNVIARKVRFEDDDHSSTLAEIPELPEDTEPEEIPAEEKVAKETLSTGGRGRR